MKFDPLLLVDNWDEAVPPEPLIEASTDFSVCTTTEIEEEPDEPVASSREYWFDFDHHLNDPTPFIGLTRAQTVVALILGSGHDPHRAAKILCVRKTTIDKHIRAIKRRYGVRTFSALMNRLTLAQYREDRSRAQYLFEEILPSLVGARIEAAFLHEGEWCGIAVRLRSGKRRKVWLLEDETGDQAGWLKID